MLVNGWSVEDAMASSNGRPNQVPRSEPPGCAELWALLALEGALLMIQDDTSFSHMGVSILMGVPWGTPIDGWFISWNIQ